jgi:hypothetical protein
MRNICERCYRNLIGYEGETGHEVPTCMRCTVRLQLFAEGAAGAAKQTCSTYIDYFTGK